MALAAGFYAVCDQCCILVTRIEIDTPSPTLASALITARAAAGLAECGLYFFSRRKVEPPRRPRRRRDEEEETIVTP